MTSFHHCKITLKAIKYQRRRLTISECSGNLNDNFQKLFVAQSVVWKSCLVFPSGQLIQVPEKPSLGLSVSDRESTASEACDSSSERSSHPPINPWLLVASNGASLFSCSHTSICGMKQLIYVKNWKTLERKVKVENLFLKCISPWLSSRLNSEAVALAQLGGVKQQRGSEKPSSRRCDKSVATECFTWWNYGLVHHL